MGWLGPKSSALRCALLSSSPRFSEFLSEALSSLGEPIARSCTSSAECVLGSQNRSQESQESVTPPVAGHLFSGTVFCVRLAGQDCFVCAGATRCSRVWSEARVRGLGQTVQLRRGFSSTIVQEVEAKCWSCEETSTASPFFVCSSCKAIQPLDQNLDFFQLLSVDRSFELEPKILEQKYKQLQKFLHPDLSSGKSEREQGYSADQSAQVIKAYYTLLEPLSRAQYMLKLNGVNVDEEGTIHDPALLMEIMELREEVEEATDSDKLVKIKEQNKKKMLDCENALKGVFQSGDITSAVPLVQRMTYFHKIIEEITRKQ